MKIAVAILILALAAQLFLEHQKGVGLQTELAKAQELRGAAEAKTGSLESTIAELKDKLQAAQAARDQDQQGATDKLAQATAQVETLTQKLQTQEADFAKASAQAAQELQAARQKAEEAAQVAAQTQVQAQAQTPATPKPSPTRWQPMGTSLDRPTGR